MALTQISTAGVKDDAVTAGKIPANAVGSSELADNAVDTAAIADDAVTADKIANSINTAIAANTAKNTNATHTGDVTGSGSLTIASGAVTTAKIADDAVTADKIANSVNSAIAANTAKTTNATHTGDVTGGTSLTIASGAVTTAKIADGTISTAKYSNSSVTTEKIANDAITGAKLGDNAVATANIGDSQVTTAKIADDAVTFAKMQNTANGVRLLGKHDSGGGAIGEITAAQARTMLNVADGSTAGGGSIKKVASRRYYGFDQTTSIGNVGFTRMDKAFVTITPSSSSNSIKLSGTMNWSGSDTENQYSFRWRREISGGSTTSLDGDLGSGTRPGIQFRLLGNGDVATMLLGPVIDQPNTTSAITYYIEVFVDGANQSVYLNRGQNDSNDPRYERAASYFIAEELDNSAHTHTNTNS